VEVKTTISFCLVSILACSCQGSRELVGLYRSNFATLGFFATAVHLKTDSTFTYHFAGDLLADKAQGVYQVKHDTVYLHYTPEQMDAQLLALPDSVRAVALAISSLNHPAVPRPARFFYKHRKLYNVTQQGHIVKREQGYSKRRKWVYWGDTYLKYRKYYLKK
jgi:hypothetical protein